MKYRKEKFPKRQIQFHSIDGGEFKVNEKPYPVPKNPDGSKKGMNILATVPIGAEVEFDGLSRRQMEMAGFVYIGNDKPKEAIKPKEEKHGSKTI